METKIEPRYSDGGLATSSTRTSSLVRMHVQTILLRQKEIVLVGCVKIYDSRFLRVVCATVHRASMHFQSESRLHRINIIDKTKAGCKLTRPPLSVP